MQDFIHPPAGLEPVAIYEDGGGLVTEYQNRAIQYRLENRRVEIHGSCRSACILALSVPNVCVYPTAVVKAHHAYEKYTQKTREDITQQMMSALPTKIRNSLEHSVQTQYTPASTLTYAELRDLGVSACSQKVKIRTVRRDTGNALDQIFRFFGR